MEKVAYMVELQSLELQHITLYNIIFSYFLRNVQNYLQ